MKAARVCLLVGISLSSLASDLDFTVVAKGRVDLYRWCALHKKGIRLHIHIPSWEIDFEFITLEGVIKKLTWTEDDLRLQPFVYHCKARFDVRLEHIAND